MSDVNILTQVSILIVKVMQVVLQLNYNLLTISKEEEVKLLQYFVNF